MCTGCGPTGWWTRWSVWSAEACGEGRTASRALGYRQVLAFLDGELTEAEARAATIAGTRRFARKQLGWFRRDPRIGWLPAGPESAAGGRVRGAGYGAGSPEVTQFSPRAL